MSITDRPLANHRWYKVLS